MSPMFDKCKEMMVASEVCVVNEYFKKWLSENSVERTTKSVLLRKLGQFYDGMSKHYENRDTRGSILDPDIMQCHFDNVLVGVTREGCFKFYIAAMTIIQELPTERVTVYKLYRTLDDYTTSLFNEMVKNAAKQYVTITD